MSSPFYSHISKIYILSGSFITSQGHKGSPSLCKIITVWGGMAVGVSSFSAVNSYLSSLTNQYNAGCKLEGGLASLFYIINTNDLLFNVVYPFIGVYFLFRHIEIDKSRRGWKFCYAIYISCAVFVFLMSSFPNFTLLFSTWDFTSRFIFRIVVLPLIVRLFMVATRFSVSRLHFLNQNDDLWSVAPIMFLSSLYSRFFTASGASYFEIALMIILSSIMDICRRYSILHLNKWLDEKVLRMNPLQVNSKYTSTVFLDRLGRLSILEILIETVVCFVVPSMQLFFQKQSLYFKFNYSLTGDLDIGLLIFSSLFGLLCQGLTDGACFTIVLGNSVNLSGTWAHMTSGACIYIYIHIYITCIYVYIYISYLYIYIIYTYIDIYTCIYIYIYIYRCK
jgi:hypothetical protein